MHFVSFKYSEYVINTVNLSGTTTNKNTQESLVGPRAELLRSFVVPFIAFRVTVLTGLLYRYK